MVAGEARQVQVPSLSIKQNETKPSCSSSSLGEDFPWFFITNLCAVFRGKILLGSMDGLLQNLSTVPQSFFIFLRGADHPRAGGPSPRSGWPVGKAGEECSVPPRTEPKFRPHLCIWVTVACPITSVGLCFLFSKMGDKYLLANFSAYIENAGHIA